MKRQTILEQVADGAPNRRRFMKALGAASAAGAALATTGSASATPSFTDADILQFALNLEYLEAEFYTVATTGDTIDKFGIDITGTGKMGLTTGGKKVSLFNTLVFTDAVAAEVAHDERSHVKYLRSALTSLGVTPIAKRAINLGALGIGFSSENDFLVLARAFEDVGVTAYGGAAPLIQSHTILGAAARILATEAEHVVNIRLEVARLRIATAPLDSVDILPPPTGTQFVSVNSDGLTQVRTPGQVLFIVYGF